MQIQLQRVTCLDCRRVSDVELVTDAPLDVAIASMKAARCRYCGSSKLGLGGSYDDAPPATAPVIDRAAWWKARGEVGTSSEAIYSAFVNWRPNHFDVPHDPDDFRRCKQLLDLIPEWRTKLGLVAAIYPWWQPFVGAWAELEQLYAAEAPSGLCPKMFERMQGLVEEANRIRRGA